MSTDAITVSEHYTGHLNGRLTGQRFTVGDIRVTKISLGGMDNNAYLLESLPDGESVLVDAAADPDALVAWLREAAPGLDTVVTTHRHPDHWQALARVKEAFAPTLLSGPVDGEAIGVTMDGALRHGDTLTVGAVALEVIGLRGHTPDGIALLLRTPEGTHLFSGDSLFPGGPGKTDGPPEFTSLVDDLESRVFEVLDDDVVVHPGHGDDTTLGTERPQLRQWRERGW